jgi:hypothetical protein
MPRLKTQAQVLLLLSALTFIGCGGVSATTRMYPDAPTFAPTDASAVEVLRNEPAIPYIRLGEITLSLKGNPSQDALSKALQKQGAQMGATAVLLVFDGSNSMGVMYSGPLWTPPPPDPMMADEPVLVGVALRYK